MTIPDLVTRQDTGPVGPGNMLLFELADNTRTIIHDFVRYASRQLKIETIPRIRIIRDASYSENNHTFGHFRPEGGIVVQIQNRQIIDILRTIAHEMVHHRQNELGELETDSGETGSKHENQANSIAGILMRNYTKQHPELFGKAAE